MTEAFAIVFITLVLAFTFCMGFLVGNRKAEAGFKNPKEKLGPKAVKKTLFVLYGPSSGLDSKALKLYPDIPETQVVFMPCLDPTNVRFQEVWHIKAKGE